MAAHGQGRCARNPASIPQDNSLAGRIGESPGNHRPGSEAGAGRSNVQIPLGPLDRPPGEFLRPGQTFDLHFRPWPGRTAGRAKCGPGRASPCRAAPSPRGDPPARSRTRPATRSGTHRRPSPSLRITGWGPGGRGCSWWSTGRPDPGRPGTCPPAARTGRPRGSRCSHCPGTAPSPARSCSGGGSIRSPRRSPRRGAAAASVPNGT